MKQLAVVLLRLCQKTFLLFVVIACQFFTANGVFAAENSKTKIDPTSTRTAIKGPNGETYLAIPYRAFFEYGRGSAKSESNASGDVVDIDANHFTIGVDFFTSSFWLWGLSLGYTNTDDDGASAAAASIKTDKDIYGGSFYLARHITPALLGGVSAFYYEGDGTAIFNGTDKVTEDSKLYGFSPYLKYTFKFPPDIKLVTGARLDFKFGDYDYVNNIPPTGETTSIVGHIPLSIYKKINKKVTLNGSATLNHVLSDDTFDNVPGPDETTVTLGLGARYRFDNGVSIYTNGYYKALDSQYDSHGAKIGLSIPLYKFFGKSQ